MEVTPWPRSAPEPSPTALAALFDTAPETAGAHTSPTPPDHLALVFEMVEVMLSVGKEVVMDMAGKREVVPVYRVDAAMAERQGWGLVPGRPTMVVVDRAGKEVERVVGWGSKEQDRRRWVRPSSKQLSQVWRHPCQLRGGQGRLHGHPRAQVSLDLKNVFMVKVMTCWS